MNNAKKKSNTTLKIPEKEFKEKSEKTEKSVIASNRNEQDFRNTKVFMIYNLNKEFDPGSGRTLAARLTHASRTENFWFTESS